LTAGNNGFFQELQIFCIRLQDVSESRLPVPLPVDVQKTIWDVVVLAAAYLSVEG
jgi:hypothetical protein